MTTRTPDPDAIRARKPHLACAILTLLGSAAAGVVLLTPALQTGLVLTVVVALLVAQVWLAFLTWYRERTLCRTIAELDAKAAAAAHLTREREDARAELARCRARLEQTNAQFDTLSTPVIPITQGVVAVPLVGAIDPARMQHIRAGLLPSIKAHRAQVAIIDLTGLTDLPPETTPVFAQVLSAIDFMGCRVILTGIDAQTARTLLKQNLKLPAETRRNLQAGIAYAADMLATATTHQP